MCTHRTDVSLDGVEHERFELRERSVDAGATSLLHQRFVRLQRKGAGVTHCEPVYLVPAHVNWAQRSRPLRKTNGTERTDFVVTGQEKNRSVLDVLSRTLLKVSPHTHTHTHSAGAPFHSIWVLCDPSGLPSTSRSTLPAEFAFVANL